MSLMLAQLALPSVMKMFREQAELSQEYMAKKVGCSQAFISMVEKGEREPTVRMVHVYAEETGNKELRWLAMGDDGITAIIQESVQIREENLRMKMAMSLVHAG